MQISESHMESYYTTRAPEYDDVYLKPERQSDFRAIENWLPPHFSKTTMLEVACGTGYWTQFIEPVAAHITAIDASSATLDFAKQRVPKGKTNFLVGDAYNLSDSLGQFNAAFAGFWFSHVPKSRRHEFLQGLGALLTPGAKVVLLDNLYVEGNSSQIVETDTDGNTYQERKLKDNSRHHVLKNFPSEAELQSSINGVGKQGVLTTWQYFWAFEYLAIGP